MYLKNKNIVYFYNYTHNIFKYMNSDSHHWRMPLVTTHITLSFPLNSCLDITMDKKSMSTNKSLKEIIYI